jgi:predicted metal-binding membrane protein
MRESTVLDALLKHDRALVLTALAGLTAVAWTYRLFEAPKRGRTGVCECLGLAMSGPDIGPWSAVAILPLFLMWAEMMVAMMIPSAAPVILLFAKVNRERRTQDRLFVPTTFFVAGYLAAWTFFSIVAALSQWALHGASFLSTEMKSASPALSGAVLVAAGLFQFTPWKRACLDQCRSPLAFLLTEWREGRSGAFAMGLRHGTFCTGCCWMLMALLFVAGVMNMLWVAAITGLVLLEKLLPPRLRVDRVCGTALVCWGLYAFFVVRPT